MPKTIKKFLPCLFCAVLTGIGTGGVIYLFKGLVSLALMLSGKAFAAVRESPVLIFVLIIGAALLGAAASVIVKWSPDSAGGGIPSAVAALRGIITLRWLRCIIGSALSATLTYAAGIPLGTEGPSVLLGTAVGKGTASLAGEYGHAIERYSMTGGACAGFAAVTGAPLTGMLFAFEEAHKKISPTVFIMAAVSVFSGGCTIDFLNRLTGGSHPLFDFSRMEAVPFTSLWFPLVIGLVCGLCAAGFTCLHTAFGRFLKKRCAKIPTALKFSVIFTVAAVLGVLSGDFSDSGHDLSQTLLNGSAVIKVLAVVLAVRMVLFITANNAGVTGGTFLPNLAFGAIIGMLCAVAGQRLGVVDPGLTTLAVTLGMTSFLGAVSKTPLMSIAFGIEALGGAYNIPAIVLAVVSAYCVMELSGVMEFAEVAIESKQKETESASHSEEYVCKIKVGEDSFVNGMETDTLFLPCGVRVVSIPRVLHAGDEVTLHATVRDVEDLTECLTNIFRANVTLEKITDSKGDRHGTEKQSIV
ncbi:MAG: chloride channel protein [Clostridia bacterium]|nr:chloride channel protein [Clostridia bacterium]